MIALVLLVGVLGGLYPAFFLSRFQPAQVLKANRSAAETPGSGRLRNALVVAQFAVSIGLIICTAVIYAPDRLRPHRRPRLQARPHPPGRRAVALPADRQGRADRRADRSAFPASWRSAAPTIGVATDNNNNTGVLVPGQHRAGQHRPLSGRRRLPRRDGPDPERRPLVRSKPADGRHDACLIRPTRRPKRRWPSAASTSSSTSLRPSGSASTIPRRRSARPFGASCSSTMSSAWSRRRSSASSSDSRFRSVREPIDPIMFRNVNQRPHS